MDENEAGIRKRFAWIPIQRFVARHHESPYFYKSGFYWLQEVVERRTFQGWVAFAFDNDEGA